MNRMIGRLMIVAAVAALGLVGCSNQDGVPPTAPAPDATADLSPAQQQAVKDALARLAEMVVPREPGLAANQDQWASVQAEMAKYGVMIEGADAADKAATAPLPGMLHLATFAAEAIAAVNGGECWSVMTSFRNNATGDCEGFSACWLIPISSMDTEHFLCNVYVDRPATWPDGTVEVEPYSEPVMKAAMRHAAAFMNPKEMVYDNTYYSDRYVVFNYVYPHHSEIGDRVGQMMQFRLAIITP